MATANPFDLLGDDDAEDPSLLVAAQQQKVDPKKTAAAPSALGKQPPPQSKATPQAKLPVKPPPPAQAGETSIFCKYIDVLASILFIRLSSFVPCFRWVCCRWNFLMNLDKKFLV